jgi:pimeloyl-ACP methyl ester carboxylesterase
MKIRNPFSIAISLFVVATLLSSQMAVIGQTRRTSQVAANKTTPAAKCSGAWTGTITYSRMQSHSDNKTVERVSGRGTDTRDWEMKYEYKAQVAVVEGPQKNGQSHGRATINHLMSSKETVVAVEKNSCDRGKTWRDMRGTSKSETSTSGSAKAEANVNVGINADGTYTVSVGVPQIQGETTGKQSTEFSGQCTPKEGKTFTMPATQTSIDGNSLTSDGMHRIDPSDPNRLSGTYSRTWQNVTESITWSLQKCGAPLRITDLKFEDMKFPNWNAWKEITEQTGTIDGNLVKIKAKVLNASGETKFADVRFKETYKGDKWDGARPDAPLNDNVVSVRLDAGEEKEVEMLWDSSGYSWFDDGRPRLIQRIKAELEEDGKKTDEMTKNLKVAPKPVVLLHGLWSNWRVFEAWQNILTTSHSYDWKAFPVGEKPENGAMNMGGAFMSTDPTKSIEENARVLQAYLKYAQEDRNAWHVDVVAHSVGGLVARYYIHNIMQPVDDGRPRVAHMLMLGTPNNGSPCADVMSTAFELVGKNVEALRQIRTDTIKPFNGLVFNRKGVKFSALAGNPLPNTCKQFEWNDGFVTVPSAVYNVKDNATSKSVHTDLTSTRDFSDFVKPRLAIGPKGNHMPERPGIGESAMADAAPTQPGIGRGYGKVINDSIWLSAIPLEQNIVPWAKAVKLAPKQVVEIEVPVEAVQNCLLDQ